MDLNIYEITLTVEHPSETTRGQAKGEVQVLHWSEEQPLCTGLPLYSICIVKKALLSIYLKSMIDERFRESYLLFYFSQIW